MSAGEPTDAALTGPAQSAPPAGREALTVEIERTREELGNTVEALVAKTDVKARAREKVAQVSGRLPERAGLKKQVAAQAETVRGQLAAKAVEAKQQVAASAGPVREQVTSQAARATATVRQAAPEPVQRAAKRAADPAGQRRVPLLVTAGAALVAGWLLQRRGRR